MVPENITKPDYAYSGTPIEEIQTRLNQVIEVKSFEEIQKMRESCLIGQLNCL